ncbi:FK506-binding protein 15 isoform X2 [Silurus meridionalis]|uniref:FK506-binding protein 15 isoform X2 n=1 Tax=Silurus meridionalis TaxID=175797 RepID=UPI001EEAFD10|nr:FK506-binding protein 15 isoform X2 [Silurus meridionalis]
MLCGVFMIRVSLLRMKEIKALYPDYHNGEFLAPKTGAKLASLFGLCQAEPEGNESFKFTAPKQPKKLPSGLGSPSQKQVPPPSTPAVLLAVAVHAFHFVNGQYVKHGKLGAAILGNYVNKEYKILLYGSQQKQIASARIHNGFILTIQPGHYAAFYDDQQQSWSLKFDSEDARIDFFKKVCVARWNSQTCWDTFLTQDLVHGEGATISMGDTVEVALSSCLLQNHTMEQLFDSKFCKDKLQRVSLDSDTPLMGWEKGMLGMQKGGRRLIIVSPSMGYESNGGPSCATHFSTLFAVEVLQVNGSKKADSSAAGSSDSNKSLVTALALCCSNQGDQAPWAKCRTPNKLPKLPEADKVKVISRMAKIGQPTVPFLKVAAPHTDYAIEESSVCVSVCGLSAQAAASSPLPVETASSLSSTAVHLPEAVNTHTVKEVHVCSDRAFQPHSSHLQPFTLTFPPQHTPYSSDVGSYMISESRQHNAEIRLAVAKVIDKVDCLASKMDELQKQGTSSFALSGGSLETAMIMHNIQRIIHENASLKKEVLERGNGVEEQDYKIGALTEQRCMEESNLLLEQTNDVLQSSGHHSRLMKAEQEKMRLVKELDVSSSCVCKLQQEVNSLQQKVTEVQTDLSAVLQESQSRCTLISCLESKVEELKREIVQSRQQWREEKQKCRKMKWTMTNTEEEIQDLKEENKSLNQLLSDKKRRWQQERERFLLEQEEQRSSSEQEQQQLLDQLRKARSIAGTYSGPQVELEWKERCDAALKEQKLKLEVITQLQIKNSKLQKELAREKQQMNAQLAGQVKLVMNGLFRSLRAEFNLQETYPGESVLTIVLNTIKVTLQFLKELKSEEDKYITAEEKTRGRIEEHGIKSEKMERPQSLDHTYMTAYETNSLEASEVSSDSFREATGELKVKGLKEFHSTD